MRIPARSARRAAVGLMILIVGVSIMSGPAAQTQQSPKKRLRHIVLYKFRDDLQAAKVEEVVAAFRKLPEQIDLIEEFEHGTNVSHEGKSQGLTHAFLVTFRSEADRDAYLEHPAHLAYVELVKTRREKVVVVDYWTEED